MIDIEYLQNDLNAVYEWTEENNMLLNGLKFEHLTYGKNDTLKQNSSYYSDTATLIETGHFKKHGTPIGAPIGVLVGVPV